TSVLYSKLRPYLNKVAIPNFAGIGTTEIVVLQPDVKKLSREFFAWFLRSPSVVEMVHKDSIGTKMPRTNMKIFRNLKTPLPPLTEQRRIVAELDALQSEVDALKCLQAETAAELDALLPVHPQ
ncbi:MAG: restriction endonuclease subunit S, partial [Verrucomicrobiota bacterium]|nr:restriction endonuclease subunit S [Verrucomicrobiota bacterium]